MAATGANSPLGQIETVLNSYFGQKAPKLPTNIQNIIVTYGPWLILVMLVISVPGLLTAFGRGSSIAPVGYMVGGGVGTYYTLSWIFLAVILVLEALALPGLFKKKKSAWNLLFYASLVSTIQSVVLMNFIGLIIGSLISFYILFQIRHHYKYFS